MIGPHRHFAPVTDPMEQIDRALLSFPLRSNQRTNRALQAAYRKFDRTEETRRLLRRYVR